MIRKMAIALIPISFYSILYACAHCGNLEWNPAIFGYQMESGDDLTFDDRDSASFHAEVHGGRSRLRLDGPAWS